jgi:ssDNA-binding Zn-finger/Zn-ribbon topoisomerase 1
MVKLNDPQNCKKCGQRGRVVNSRPRDGYWWRQRECPRCMVSVSGKSKPHRWNTYETMSDPTMQRLPEEKTIS